MIHWNTKRNKQTDAVYHWEMILHYARMYCIHAI